MPICKRIVEKHDGKIWVESQGLGKGSTVYISLPNRIGKTKEIYWKSNESKTGHTKITEEIDQLIEQRL